jgi:N-acetylglucosaminyldiphosphoundecaprenol N-acetyl-beta-D-mannosaminyltransferase
MRIRDLKLLKQRRDLETLPDGKLLINTVNAYSFTKAQVDPLFAESLTKCDVLIPDGWSIVGACRFLNMKDRPVERTAGWDLFEYEMDRLNRKGGVVMFMGSSEKVLSLIREKAAEIYPNLKVETYSPPYKPEFSEEDNRNIIQAINQANPDLLWIGMTAPKQEKWVYSQWGRLDIHCHCGSIGAVFDFFAGTAKRAPKIWQDLYMEWLYRLLLEPSRMWRRYIIGNAKFIGLVLKERFA